MDWAVPRAAWNKSRVHSARSGGRAYFRRAAVRGRTIQPVLEDLDQEYEEAAATLGASRLQTFILVIAPALIPALLTGFALAFARALGEYGSVVFISGNMPMHTEVVPLLIMSKLEQFDYAGATAIAVVMLSVSFVILLGVNMLQRWSSRRLAA